MSPKIAVITLVHARADLVAIIAAEAGRGADLSIAAPVVIREASLMDCRALKQPQASETQAVSIPFAIKIAIQEKVKKQAPSSSISIIFRGLRWQPSQRDYWEEVAKSSEDKKREKNRGNLLEFLNASYD
ncbi:hypothetical protein BGZ99_003040 [Dissophora globulifera]|uniref:Uncharacterized protein n=1 Tax=Dissophora globulifera TaxID=979702 RepID=A0A9P6RZM5_9FUNG|nr:hypothetical protein BGZ99_003040 [Dissophora globulifera]